MVYSQLIIKIFFNFKAKNNFSNISTGYIIKTIFK